jgi:uroporphyrinogen III methyltransferase/synthase
VTRAREQASELRAQLESLGATVLELPSIVIEPLPFEVPDLAQYAWVVFTSVNGVTHFFERGLHTCGRDARALGAVRVAAIGPGTATALTRYGINADLVPERFVAESLLDAMPAPAAPHDRVLLARAEKARDVLPEGLHALGYEADVLAVYRTVPATPDPDDLARVRAGAVDAITFTSSSTVENFCDVVGAIDDAQPLVVSIGPITSKTAQARGLRVDAQADPHTIAGLIDALVAALA